MIRHPSMQDYLTPENLEHWLRVQESFARITGLSIWTIDPEGKVIGQPSSPPGLCVLLRKNPESRSICNRDCISNCQTALRNNRTVFFRCHAELQCFATPLLAGGKPVGVILGGQVLTGSPPLEKYRNLARLCVLPEKDLMKSVSQLTIGNEKILRQSAEFVTDMAEIIFTGWEEQSHLARRLTILNNLFTLSAEFSPMMDQYELYALILNSLAVLFDLGSACLFTQDGPDRPMKAGYALGPDRQKLMGMKLNHKEPFLEKFYSEPGPFSTGDYYLLLRAGFPESINRMIVFPLFTGESLNGMLAVFNRDLDENEEKMVSYFINQASANIQNAMLRRELNKNVSNLARISRFNEKIKSTMEMDELLGIIFEETANMAMAEQASLMVLNEKTRQLMVKLVKGSRKKILKNFAVPFGEGIAGQVARKGEPILVKDLSSDARFNRESRPRYKTPSFVILPLKASGRIIGVLNITDKINGEIYNEEDLLMLQSLATQATVALERSELFRLSRELKKISITDPLTNLLNRRYFHERATEEIERASRYGSSLSLIMLDVDNFKFYNDRHGHVAGDSVLKNVGSIIKGTVRNIDIVSRYGGEEFAVLSPSTVKSKAHNIAERIRLAIKSHIFPGEKEQPGGDVTISAGVATYPEDAPNLEELINNADKALYLSKRGGRDQTSFYSMSA